jgi:hypothetical protein
MSLAQQLDSNPNAILKCIFSKFVIHSKKIWLQNFSFQKYVLCIFHKAVICPKKARAKVNRSDISVSNRPFPFHPNEKS